LNNTKAFLPNYKPCAASKSQPILTHLVRGRTSTSHPTLQAILDELLASVDLSETLAERIKEHMAATLLLACQPALANARAGRENEPVPLLLVG
jgi:hypothetical protein